MRWRASRASAAAPWPTSRTDGIAAFAGAYLGFTQETTSWLLLLPWFVLAGIGIGCVETAEHAAVATHAPGGLRGSAFGLLAGVQSLGNLAASAIAGILWTAISPTAAFLYLAVWMLVALICMLVPSNRRPSGLDDPPLSTPNPSSLDKS